MASEFMVAPSLLSVGSQPRRPPLRHPNSNPPFAAQHLNRPSRFQSFQMHRPRPPNQPSRMPKIQFRNQAAKNAPHPSRFPGFRIHRRPIPSQRRRSAEAAPQISPIGEIHQRSHLRPSSFLSHLIRPHRERPRVLRALAVFLHAHRIEPQPIRHREHGADTAKRIDHHRRPP